MRGVTAALLLIPLSLAAMGGDDPGAKSVQPSSSFDPAKHAWARFGVGSWITAKSVLEAGKEKKEQVLTFVLKEVTKQDCSVLVYEGGIESKKETGAEHYALTVPESVLNRLVGPKSGAVPKLVGSEKIKAAGQTFSCSLYEFELGDNSVHQVAVADSGLRVQRTTGTRKDGKLIDTTVENLVKVRETVKLGGKQIECARYEQNDEVLGERYTAWESEAIPGGVARSELISKGDDGKEVKNSVEIVAWKCVERK